MQLNRMLKAFFSCFLLILVLMPATYDSAMAGRIVSGVDVRKGSIFISTSKRKLLFGLGNGKAVEYRVGVGRQDRQWTGQRYIRRKAKKPAWKATPDILKDKPHLTGVIPGGAPNNPMGAAALVISGGGQYAIHGTNRPGSIGGFVSYGCIRMHNKDIIDLYNRVNVGTRITVVK